MSGRKRTLQSIEPFTNKPENKKYCVNCGSLATQIAYFDADGASIIERYCDNCIKLIKIE